MYGGTKLAVSPKRKRKSKILLYLFLIRSRATCTCKIDVSFPVPVSAFITYLEHVAALATFEGYICGEIFVCM